MSGTSLWHAITDCAIPEALPALPAEVPVAILGAGISGGSAFYSLAGRGARPLLLEQHHVAWGATGRNAGFLLGGTVEYYSEAVARFGKAQALGLWAFTLENNRAVKNAIRRERIACDLQVEGQLILAQTPEEWEAIRETVRLMLDSGLETQLLSASGVEERTGLTGFHGARVQPEDAILNPAALIVGLVRAGVREGGQVATDTRVEALEPEGEGWRIVTSRGATWAGHLIVTTNAWLRELWPAFREVVVPVRAQALATVPIAPGRICGALSTNFGYEYWRQTPDLRVLIGGKRWTEADAAFDTLDSSPQAPTSEQLREFLGQLYPDLQGIEIAYEWAGLMAFSKDHLPLIGRLPGAQNAYVAAGYTGHGMAFGFLAGRLLGEFILEGEPSMDLSAVDPGRFGVRAGQLM